MSRRPPAYVAGVYEHPERVIETASIATVHVDIVAGVLAGVITAAGGLKGGGIAQVVVGKMKQTIEQVGGKS